MAYGSISGYYSLGLGFERWSLSSLSLISLCLEAFFVRSLWDGTVL